MAQTLTIATQKALEMISTIVSQWKGRKMITILHRPSVGTKNDSFWFVIRDAHFLYLISTSNGIQA